MPEHFNCKPVFERPAQMDFDFSQFLVDVLNRFETLKQYYTGKLQRLEPDPVHTNHRYLIKKVIQVVMKKFIKFF